MPPKRKGSDSEDESSDNKKPKVQGDNGGDTETVEEKVNEAYEKFAWLPNQPRDLTNEEIYNKGIVPLLEQYSRLEALCKKYDIDPSILDDAISVGIGVQYIPEHKTVKYLDYGEKEEDGDDGDKEEGDEKSSDDDADKKPLGYSKIGGKPHLPENHGIEWEDLLFLGQFNMKEFSDCVFHQAKLPGKTGLWYFFGAESEDHVMKYIDAESKDLHVEEPPNGDPEGHIMECMRPKERIIEKMVTKISLPPFQIPEASEEENEKYEKMVDDEGFAEFHPRETMFYGAYVCGQQGEEIEKEETIYCHFDHPDNKDCCMWWSISDSNPTETNFICSLS